jgi:hypothetical protein
VHAPIQSLETIEDVDTQRVERTCSRNSGPWGRVAEAGRERDQRAKDSLAGRRWSLPFFTPRALVVLKRTHPPPVLKFAELPSTSPRALGMPSGGKGRRQWRGGGGVGTAPAADAIPRVIGANQERLRRRSSNPLALLHNPYVIRPMF